MVLVSIMSFIRVMMWEKSFNPLETNFPPFQYKIFRSLISNVFSSNKEDHSVKRNSKKCHWGRKLRNQEPC